MKKYKNFILLKLIFGLSLCIPQFSFSQTAASPDQPQYVPGSSGVTLPSLSLSFPEGQKPQETVSVIRMILMLTVLSLAPSILIMMTSFTRMIVVLSFLRQALGTQQMPPNQLLVGLSLFLSFFVMGPTFMEASENGIKPFLEEKITQQEAFDRGIAPFRKFMLSQVREKDLELFISLSKAEKPKSKDEVSLLTLIPAFIISELKTAFQIGFVIYIPFLVLDMVVASVLMAMGMMMLPPVVISLPFKILLFVLVDGWDLIVGSLVRSFGG